MVVLHLLVMLELVCTASLGPDDISARVSQLEHELSTLRNNGELGGNRAVSKDRLAELDKQLAAVHKQWDSLQAELQDTEDNNSEENIDHGSSATVSIYETNKGALI